MRGYPLREKPWISTNPSDPSSLLSIETTLFLEALVQVYGVTFLLRLGRADEKV